MNTDEVPRPIPRAIVLRAALPTRRDALLPADAPIRIVSDSVLDGVALGVLVTERPEVAIIDLRGALAAEVAPAIRRVRDASPAIRIVAIGDAGADADVLAQQTIAAGVSAYLSQDPSPENLLRAVTEAAAGQLHLTRTGQKAVRVMLGGEPPDAAKR
jgi:DNA-binding NarL/FixJ family response regulator